MLTRHHYEMAVLSQSACNLSGIVFGFAEAMKEICAEANVHGHGTEWKNNHPICRLYAEQIMHLTSSKDWKEALDACEEYIAVDKAAEQENILTMVEKGVALG